MKLIKRSAAGLVFALLILSLTGAGAEVAKTEVVYAALSSSGDVSGVYIVNDFEATEPEAIVDFGNYIKVTNLLGIDPVDYDEGQVTYDMPAGRWQYQGNPESMDIPWDIRIDYTLDGEAITPDKLSGAEGMLEIGVKVSVDPKLRAHARDVTLQITLTLDGMKAWGIDAPNATLAVAGVNRTLSFIMMPGIEEKSFLVKARVSDFSMGAIQIAGVCMVTDIAMYKEIAEKSLGDSPLKGAAGGFIDSFLGGTRAAPLSFADERNGEIAAVQYVFMVDGITPRVQPIETAVQPVEHETVWARMLSLFGQ